MFHTKRLQIIPARLQALIAEFHGRQAVERELGVSVPDSWPPELLDEKAIQSVFDRLKDRPTEADWWFHYFVNVEHNTVIGAGGYKGPPDAGGVVEIGYSILPEYRNLGYASEAVHALVEHAFDVALVKKVVAETWPEFKVSVGVLQKCGFDREDEASEEGAVRFSIRRSSRKILPPAC
jgi:[ribosomal protein S5]-alanine N-acetyltransferase